MYKSQFRHPHDIHCHSISIFVTNPFFLSILEFKTVIGRICKNIKELSFITNSISASKFRNFFITFKVSIIFQIGSKLFLFFHHKTSYDFLSKIRLNVLDFQLTIL